MKNPFTEATMDFVGRQAEQMLVTFAVAFISAYTVSGLSLSHSALAAAAGAGMRAVYGYVVKNKGSFANMPSLK